MRRNSRSSYIQREQAEAAEQIRNEGIEQEKDIEECKEHKREEDPTNNAETSSNNYL